MAKTTKAKAKEVVVESTPESKLDAIKKEVAVVTKSADKFLKVTSEATRAEASEFTVAVKRRITRIEELRVQFVKPLNDHVKNINAMFKAQSQPLEVIYDRVDSAIRNYSREQIMAARAEEERLAKLREKKNERREEAGKPIDLTPLPVVEVPSNVVAVDGGKVVTKMVWKYRVVDINKVPREMLRCEIKHAEVMKAIALGSRAIDGLELYEDVDTSTTVY